MELNYQAGLIYSVMLLLLFFFYYHKKRKVWEITRWQKNLRIKENQFIFQQLYQSIDGFFISLNARQKYDVIEYTYGEIEFLPFIALLSLVQPSDKTVFYDLGCGTGKAVIACALVYPIIKSIGIEIIPELYHTACSQKAQLTDLNQRGGHVEFILGDILEIDLCDATLIFINSTTFLGTLWENLCNRLNELPQLETVITTSKPLAAANFILIKKTKVQMSWGIVPVFIHIKKTDLDKSTLKLIR